MVAGQAQLGREGRLAVLGHLPLHCSLPEVIRAGLSPLLRRPGVSLRKPALCTTPDHAGGHCFIFIFIAGLFLRLAALRLGFRRMLSITLSAKQGAARRPSVNRR